MVSLSSPHVEPVVWSHYDEIKQALEQSKEDLVLAGTKVMAKDMDADKALNFLYRHSYMFLVHGYLVCYVIDVPWFLTKPVLVEMLVLRLRPGGTFRDVTAFLEDQANLHECSYVSTGTMLAASDGPLSNAYGRQGYGVSAISMIKEVP